MPYVSLQDYVAAACSDGVVALPTDTVWGVATNPKNSARLYELKQRSLAKSLILMGANAVDLWPYIIMETEQWQKITHRYWPGQLTLVVPSSAKVPLAMHPNTPNTVGVRVPNHPVARQILSLTGPLATTSANLSGQPTLLSVEQVLAQFPQVYGLDDDGLQTLLNGTMNEIAMSPPSGLPSTVAKWELGRWQVLRQGTVYL